MKIDKHTRALIVGASGGIGKAIVDHLLTLNVSVTQISRSTSGFDITNEQSVSNMASTLVGPFDLIFVATGALEINGAAPEKSINHITQDAMMDQFATNALGPALLLKHLTPLLASSNPSVFVTLSARIGSIQDNKLGGWISYRAAKAAVNQIVKTTAIELKRKRPDAICIALHPGTVATKLTAKYARNYQQQNPNEAAQKMINLVQSLSPDQTGQFLAYDGTQIEW